MPVNYDLASEGGMKVFGDGGEDAAGVVQFTTGSTTTPVLTIGRTTIGATTIGYLKLLGTSAASGAIINFAGGFISCTSTVLTTVANTDYAIPVQVGLEVRYIPLFKAAAVIGGATF